MIEVKKIFIVISIMMLLKSCKNNQNKIINHYDKIEKIEKVGVDKFFNIQFDSRNKQGNKYIIYRFIIYDDSSKYVLPNYNFFGKEKIMDPLFCDVEKFSSIYNNTKNSNFDFVKKISMQRLEDFDKLNFYKIYNDKKNMGSLIVFYISECEFYMFIDDINSVKKDYWKMLINNSKKINSNWYYKSCSEKW